VTSDATHTQREHAIRGHWAIEALHQYRGRMPKRFVLFYESAEGSASKVPLFMAAHMDRLVAFHERGDLLLVGPFGDPQEEGSMGIFASREAVEEFVAGDPFVTGGVMRAWHIREWDELFGS